MKNEVWRKNESVPKRGSATTAEERRAIISHLIQKRERLRDERIQLLEKDADALLKWHKKQVLWEELACFKNILRLHWQAQQDDDEQGD